MPAFLPIRYIGVTAILTLTIGYWQLVHIPDVGTFQLSRIVVIADPYPLKQVKRGDMELDASVQEGTVLDQPDDEQESLESLADADMWANEQTFPTDEELAAAESTFYVPL